jgi:hypothetical protein
MVTPYISRVRSPRDGAVRARIRGRFEAAVPAPIDGPLAVEAPRAPDDAAGAVVAELESARERRTPDSRMAEDRDWPDANEPRIDDSDRSELPPASRRSSSADDRTPPAVAPDGSRAPMAAGQPAARAEDGGDADPDLAPPIPVSSQPERTPPQANLRRSSRPHHHDASRGETPLSVPLPAPPAAKSVDTTPSRAPAPITGRTAQPPSPVLEDSPQPFVEPITTRSDQAQAPRVAVPSDPPMPESRPAEHSGAPQGRERPRSHIPAAASTAHDTAAISTPPSPAVERPSAHAESLLGRSPAAGSVLGLRPPPAPLAHAPARRRPETPPRPSEPQTEVNVTIERVEVRVPASAPTPARPPTGPRRRPPTLDEYLQARARGRAG